VLAAVGLCALAFSAQARADAVVELVTIGPDKPIDMRFGHILLRVVDERTRRDDAYDFGVWAYEGPLFMLEAMLGRGVFSLRRSPAQVRFSHYWMQDRLVVAQRLNLSEAQVREVRERLATNLLPENRDYLYDHVLDNCSTRLRDLIDAVTRGALRRAADELPVRGTFRDDIRVAGSGWLPALIGYDWVAGRHAEDPMGAWERAFLPEHLAGLVAAAENPVMGDAAPLVAATEVLHARQAPSVLGGSVDAGRRAMLGFGGLLGLVFAAAGWAARRGRLPQAAGRGMGAIAIAVFFVFGVVGLVMAPMRWLSSGHVFSANENAWLMLPLDLLLIAPAVSWLRTGKPQLGRLARGYLALRAVPVGLLALGISAQQNGAFVAAAACVWVGLLCLPATRGETA
jgi:hypothetical protein